jgi:hypothetical protein
LFAWFISSEFALVIFWQNLSNQGVDFGKMSISMKEARQRRQKRYLVLKRLWLAKLLLQQQQSSGGCDQ